MVAGGFISTRPAEIGEFVEIRKLEPKFLKPEPGAQSPSLAERVLY